MNLLPPPTSIGFPAQRATASSAVTTSRHGALEPCAKIRHIDGPDEALALIPRQLRFDHDAKHWHAIEQQHDQIGPILRGLDVREIG